MKKNPCDTCTGGAKCGECVLSGFRDTCYNNVQKRLFALHKTSDDLADAIGRTPEHLCAVMAGRQSKKVRAAVKTLLQNWLA